MLPLLITFLLAAYVLGPDLIARWLISFSVPRRAVVQSRSEEWSRSILWCFVPLCLAWVAARHAGVLAAHGGRTTAETVFSGLYQESYFAAHRSEFFSALSAFWWINLGLLWRLYLVVVVVSGVLMITIHNYGTIRSRLERHSFWQALLALIVLPRVSDWHVLLSRMLLPSKNVQLVLDVLTKSDHLYQGRLADKTLGADGTLVNVVLAEPVKFRRDRYLEAVRLDPQTNADDFWNKIPGKSFVIMASDIGTLNIRYSQGKANSERAPDVVAALRELALNLENTTRSG